MGKHVCLKGIEKEGNVVPYRDIAKLKNDDYEYPQKYA